MLEYREEKHYSEEYEKTENQEKFHGIAVGESAAFSIIFSLCEYEGFVGVTECLGEHNHDYGDLNVCAIDADHRAGGFLASFEDIGNKHLPHVLAHYSGDSQNEQRPAVCQHLAEESAFDAESVFANLRQQACHDNK